MSLEYSTLPKGPKVPPTIFTYLLFNQHITDKKITMEMNLGIPFILDFPATIEIEANINVKSYIIWVFVP